MGGHLSIVSDEDLRRLRARWLGTQTLEERLIRAFDQMNRCWKCRAELLVDAHPNCTDCPEYGCDPDAEAHIG